MQLQLNDCKFCGKKPRIKSDILFDARSGELDKNQVFIPEIVELVNVKCCGVEIEDSKFGITHKWNTEHPQVPAE